MGLVFLIIGLILITALVIFIQRSGGFGFPWVQFYVKGKESGFKFRELNLLRRVAVENRLKNPTALFWSEKQLDRCIRGTIIRFRSKDKESDESSILFLNKLFDFRKRVEFNLPKYRLGLRSTRNIDTSQRLKITFPGAGVYQAKVVENMRKYLAISYPQGNPLPPGFSWKGERINIYFWRQEDAGYYFESKVIGDYLDKKYPILHISHSDNLVRTQKRNSIRADLNKPGKVFPLRTIEGADEEEERFGGYRGKMIDISEDGAAILVGGRAKTGLPVKLQTEFLGNTIVMCGIIKGVNYNRNKHVSTLHIQAVPPSPIMKNNILTYVYGIFKEAESARGQIHPNRSR
ncbi:MAG: PilZ domain-containing protein [Spirochaetia bacterium]